MDCGQNFYAEAGGELADDAMLDDRTFDYEEALRAAEMSQKKHDEGPQDQSHSRPNIFAILGYPGTPAKSGPI
jgi:hypothetical protein